jgi:hypothetical protein
LSKHGLADHRMIEVRGYKWPDRPTGVSPVHFLGQDAYGRWLGSTKGDPLRMADGSRSGVFLESFVKLVPAGTFWTVCFDLDFPVVDVDIVLPVSWVGDVLEEVDLELDILRSPDGTVQVRDRDEFERVQSVWPMPADIVAQAEETCERIRALVELGAEPFGTVGHAWLTRFLAEVGAADA